MGWAGSQAIHRRNQSELRLHFGLGLGLGQARIVDTIEVKWPTTQNVERITQLQPNQILTIREGGGIVDTFKRRPKQR